MAPPPTAERERQVLEAARGGDESAYARLVEPYRAELHAHCYRMLGSVHDAEDAMQETMLRAWRGVLILREVLGFSAKEVAEALDTSVASVNSALQRARKSVDERLPEQSQQATLRALGDDGLRDVVDRYVDAWQRGDVDGVVAMLTEDAAFAMPPLRSWFRGHDALRVFLAGWPLSGQWDWRTVRALAGAAGRSAPARGHVRALRPARAPPLRP